MSTPMQPQRLRDINDMLQEMARHLLAGGTVRGFYGIEERELEAVYAHAYHLYNQARWLEAFAVFSFLCMHDHLQRRFHLGRAACLQMLKDHEAALKAYGAAYLLDVSDPTTSLRIAECLIALRRKAEACAVLQTIEDLTAQNPTFAATRTRAAALVALLKH
jgi:type III secretion system low calcium response chaperone LcrH/SycD